MVSSHPIDQGENFLHDHVSVYKSQETEEIWKDGGDCHIGGARYLNRTDDQRFTRALLYH